MEFTQAYRKDTLVRRFWLCLKRLSQGRFPHWPTAQPGQVLAAQELVVLLAGGDWSAAAGVPPWRLVS